MLSTYRIVGNRYLEGLLDRSDQFFLLRTQSWQAFSDGRQETVHFNKAKGQPPPACSPYIIVPMNIQKNHWVLGIIAHLADIRVKEGLDSCRPVNTAVFLFDSLAGDDEGSSELLGRLRNFALELASQVPEWVIQTNASGLISTFKPTVPVSFALVSTAMLNCHTGSPTG